MGIVLLLSVVAAGAAILIGAGPVELNSDEYVNITPTNSTETYEVPQATVLGALDAASIRGAFEYEVALDLSPEEGNLSILSIDGVENEVLNETPHAWTFRVNDEVATTGPAVTGVADGDEIVFSYGPPDHSVENASYTLNVFASVSGAAENVTPTPAENVTPTTPAENVTPTTPAENVTPTTPAENVTPVAEVSVNITAPEEGADVAAGNVTVSVDVTNFTLVEPTGQENAPGEGHLHYYLDALIPTDENEPAIPETGGYVISTNTSYTWEGVTSGEHNFSVQLVNNDHTPIIPLAADLVNVTVSEEVAPTPDENVTPTPTEEVPAANVADEIVAGLSGEGDLTTFADAVNRSAVFQALDVNGTYVVCAPTDEAFSDLDNETFSMFQNDTEFQDSVLRYHIIEGDYTLEELVMMCQDATDGQITLPTVEGADVNVSLSEGGEVVINNAHAVAQIQITNNIVIYVINAVLIPPGIPTPTPTPTEEVTPTPT
ncbi:MAG: fasciclin domain-containing protein, partial [Methanoculleus sp.]